MNKSMNINWKYSSSNAGQFQGLTSQGSGTYDLNVSATNAPSNRATYVTIGRGNPCAGVKVPYGQTTCLQNLALAGAVDFNAYELVSDDPKVLVKWSSGKGDKHTGITLRWDGNKWWYWWDSGYRYSSTQTQFPCSNTVPFKIELDKNQVSDFSIDLYQSDIAGLTPAFYSLDPDNPTSMVSTEVHVGNSGETFDNSSDWLCVVNIFSAVMPSSATLSL